MFEPADAPPSQGPCGLDCRRKLSPSDEFEEDDPLRGR